MPDWTYTFERHVSLEEIISAYEETVEIGGQLKVGVWWDNVPLNLDEGYEVEMIKEGGVMQFGMVSSWMRDDTHLGDIEGEDLSSVEELNKFFDAIVEDPLTSNVAILFDLYFSSEYEEESELPNEWGY